MPINAPSLANLSLVEFGGRLRELKDSGVNFFHIDLMDGHYVPALCLPPRTVRDVKVLCPDAVAEVHLMVDDPTPYLDELRDNGADYPVVRQAAALGVDVLVTGIYMIFAQPDGIPGAVRRFNAEFPR